LKLPESLIEKSVKKAAEKAIKANFIFPPPTKHYILPLFGFKSNLFLRQTGKIFFLKKNANG